MKMTDHLKRIPGRKREIPVHPSWANYMQFFDSTSKEKSQNAFCRWAKESGAWEKASPAKLSISMRRQITEKRVVQILDWANKVETNTLHEVKV
jgi:hypothetical protein